MLFFLRFFNFSKSISDCTHCDSIVLAVEVADDDFAGSLIGVVLLLRLAILVALHGVGLAAASLPVGKDGCMITIDNFLDEAWHLEAFEHVLLGVVACEDFVECVVFPGVVILLINAQLVFFRIDRHQLLGVPVFLLVREHGADSDGNSDI